MSETVIRVENLGKKYILQHQQQERYTALRDVIAKSAKNFGRRLLTPSYKKTPNLNQEEFWALKDVSFEVKQGDRVGIIGRNGAGKSTLLKILSRITEPTTGTIRIKGRVASLLEVGTGFHPELTGRENIYLNGAILGMSKTEIRRKFDEIVAFAEVERFLDTPVKRYSSGMYVRLAFAVAAHLEPEILVVDEVLAVGDAQFQKKCLGKMENIARQEGRTVLFVSHNMGAVKSLCNTGVWLDSGQLKAHSNASKTITDYLAFSGEQGTVSQVSKHQRIKGNSKVLIEKIELLSIDNFRQNSFLIGEPFQIRLHYKVNIKSRGSFWLFINGLEGDVLVSSFQKDVQDSVIFCRNGFAVVDVNDISLLPGKYFVSAGILGIQEIFDWVDCVAKFEVLPHFNNGDPFDHRYGLLTKSLNWKVMDAKA